MSGIDWYGELASFLVLVIVMYWVYHLVTRLATIIILSISLATRELSVADHERIVTEVTHIAASLCKVLCSGAIYVYIALVIRGYIG